MVVVSNERFIFALYQMIFFSRPYIKYTRVQSTAPIPPGRKSTLGARQVNVLGMRLNTWLLRGMMITP